MTPTTEAEGWRDIARMVGRTLGCSVSEKTAARYAAPSWPTADDPHPLPVGQRGNGVRFLAARDLEAWVQWFRGRAGAVVRHDVGRRAGDRRRAKAA